MAGLLSGKKLKVTYEKNCNAPNTGSYWVLHSIQLSN